LNADGALIGDIEMAADATADNYLDVRPIAAALKSIHKKAGQR
jgi:hypothetical protein